MTRPLGGSFPTGARDLALIAWCWRNCTFTDSMSARIEQALLTLREDAPPAVDRVGGSIADPGPRRGSESLVYDASDGDSGVRRLTVRAGDTDLGTDLTATCTYTDFHACPTRLRDRVVAIDTTRLADGEHRLTLIAEDAAGNIRRVDGPTFVVANGSGGRVAPPLDKRLTAVFSVNRRDRLTVAFGLRVRLRGRLVDRRGAAVGGAEIEVAGRSTVAGSRYRALTRAVTSSSGAWKLVLPAHLPSTRLTIRANGAEPKSLRLSVRAGVVLRAATRTVRPHGTIKLRGRLKGGPMPPRGKLVEFRVRGAAGRWLTFRTARSDRRGRFAISYRLQRGYRGITYEFQAVSRYEPSYPYATGRSRSVRVHVG